VSDFAVVTNDDALAVVVVDRPDTTVVVENTHFVAAGGGSGGGGVAGSFRFSQSDVILGRSTSGTGAGEEIPCNAFGRSVIAATVAAGAILFASSASAMGTEPTKLFWDEANDRLGVGTNAPGYAVDVVGFVNVDAASGYKQGGGTVLITRQGATLGTFVGGTAGNPTATDPGHGYGVSGNTAVGYQALYACRGPNNTAVGHRALYSLTGSATPGALGGVANVAIGVNALYNLSGSGGGWTNVAIGNDTLFSLTTGAGNVAIGHNALALCGPSATTCIAVGLAAMLSHTGVGNVGIGADALRNGSGQNNVSIGDASMRNSTSAGNNIALGRSALRDITTGSSNIYLGAATITAAFAAVTTGGSNIIIGNDAAVPSATGSNQLSIGNLIYGFGMTGTGTTAAGRVVIGTTTDDGVNRLQVAGGVFTSALGSASAPSYALGVASTGMYTQATGNALRWTIVGTQSMVLGQGGGLIVDTVTFGGLGASAASVTTDAAHVVAQRTGANAQAFRLYRTYTNSSNYERLALQTGAGYVEVAAETAGTGTDDLDLRLTPAGAGTVRVNGALKLGNTVASVSPTSPNRTIAILHTDGNTYYVHAKTTND
jgi:hypothetical protein